MTIEETKRRMGLDAGDDKRGEHSNGIMRSPEEQISRVAKVTPFETPAPGLPVPNAADRACQAI
jgi:hypothetical protein